MVLGGAVGWWLRVGLIEGEILLALWLGIGRATHRVRWAAIACFAAFFAVSLAGAMKGEKSCGCFGNVPLSPWLVAAVDLAVCAALWLWHPPTNPNTAVPSLLSGPAIAAVLVLGIGTALAILHEPARLSAHGEIEGGRGAVRVEPEQWVGKPFPLLPHIDIAPELARGDWVVVLYRPDCSHCQEVVQEYRRVASVSREFSARPRVALIEIALPHEERPVGVREAGGWTQGRLTNERDWLVQVPLTLTLREGQVTGFVKENPDTP